MIIFKLLIFDNYFLLHYAPGASLNFFFGLILAQCPHFFFLQFFALLGNLAKHFLHIILFALYLSASSLSAS